MGDEFMESYEEVEQDRLSIWMTFEHGIYILKTWDWKLVGV